MTRLTLAVLVLVACAAPPTDPEHRPSRPALVVAPLTTDISKAVTPTPVSAGVIATVTRDGGTTIDSIRVTWIDNETRADEFITCARFVGAAGEPVMTDCAYAHESETYDQPAGTTGERTVTMIAPAVAATQAYLWTARYVTIETMPGSFATMSIHSDESAPIAVQPLVVVTTNAKGKKKR